MSPTRSAAVPRVPSAANYRPLTSRNNLLLLHVRGAAERLRMTPDKLPSPTVPESVAGIGFQHKKGDSLPIGDRLFAPACCGLTQHLPPSSQD